MGGTSQVNVTMVLSEFGKRLEAEISGPKSKKGRGRKGLTKTVALHLKRKIYRLFPFALQKQVKLTIMAPGTTLMKSQDYKRRV